MKSIVLLVLLFCFCTHSPSTLDFQEGKKLLFDRTPASKTDTKEEFTGLLSRLDIPAVHIDSLSAILRERNSILTLSRSSFYEAYIDTLYGDNNMLFSVLRLEFLRSADTALDKQNICVIVVVRNSQGKNVLLKSFILKHCSYVESDVKFLPLNNHRYAVTITEAPFCRGRKEWTVHTDTIVLEGQNLKYLNFQGTKQEFSKSVFDDEQSPILREYPEDELTETRVISENLSAIHSEAVSLFKEGKRELAVTLLMDSAGKAFIDDITNGKNDITPDNVGIFNDLGYFLEQTGNAQDAMTILNAIIEVFPNRSVVYLNVGDAYRQIQHHEKMIENYRIYVEMMSDAGKKEKIPQYVKDSLNME
jgi:hypothetical protein